MRLSCNETEESFKQSPDFYGILGSRILTRYLKSRKVLVWVPAHYPRRRRGRWKGIKKEREKNRRERKGGSKVKE